MRRTVLLAFFSVLSLLPIACGGAPTTAATRSPQQWEYTVVTLNETTERNLQQILNSSGMAGWEYVGQLTGKDEHLVFKRPRQASISGGAPNGVTYKSSFKYGGSSSTPPTQSGTATSSTKIFAKPVVVPSDR